MLSNLDWLKEGQIFPPEDERDRLARYAQNKLVYVIAYTYTEEQERGPDKHFLSATVYDKTTYRKMTFEMATGLKNLCLTIGKKIKDSGRVQTGLTDFAVIPVHNTVTSDTVYGTDDYTDLDSIETLNTNKISTTNQELANQKKANSLQEVQAIINARKIEEERKKKEEEEKKEKEDALMRRAKAIADRNRRLKEAALTTVPVGSTTGKAVKFRTRV